MSLTLLPRDVWIGICRHWLSTVDVLHLRLTCTTLSHTIPIVIAESLCDLHALCSAGKLAALKCIGLTADSVREQELLYDACESNRDHVVHWIVDTFHYTADDVRERGDMVLRVTCQQGNSALAHWLVQRFGTPVEQLHAMQGLAFVCACANGHLSLAHSFDAEMDTLVVEPLASEALACACKFDHLPVARWLVERFSMTQEQVRGALTHGGRLGLFSEAVSQWLACEWNIVPKVEALDAELDAFLARLGR